MRRYGTSFNIRSEAEPRGSTNLEPWSSPWKNSSTYQWIPEEWTKDGMDCTPLETQQQTACWKINIQMNLCPMTTLASNWKSPGDKSQEKIALKENAKDNQPSHELFREVEC